MMLRGHRRREGSWPMLTMLALSDGTGSWANALTVFGPALFEIIILDIVLSGDNAVVIALACAGLPKEQRALGVMLGAGVGILLRIIFTLGVGTLLALPWIKLVGGLLLLWIAVKLLLDRTDGHNDIQQSGNIWGAVRTVALADVVMSLDNVLAIAAAAKGNWTLIIFGLLLSIPLIVYGATLVMSLLQRFPIIVWFGAALLGWVAGEMIAEERILAPYLHDLHLTGLEAIIGKFGAIHYLCAAAGAAFVVLVGLLVRPRLAAAH
jgi:YjbE family integral membrane protein